MRDLEEVVGVDVLVFDALLIVCTIGGYLVIRNKLTWMPESTISIFAGALTGFLIRLWYGTDFDLKNMADFADGSAGLLTMLSFNPEIFFYVLLPPIIFESGFSLKRRMFFQNIGSILTFAVFGTLISTFVIGYMLYWAGMNGLHHSLDTDDNPLQCLLFAALISAVDPVATLSILGSPEVNADPLLMSLVFGESVLNDAVSVVLFDTMETFVTDTDTSFTGTTVLSVVGNFVLISLGSTVVGVLLALLLSYYLRHSLYRKVATNLEISLTFLSCYMSYLVAEVIGLSGILAIFFNGVTLAHYCWYNLSSTSQVVTGHFFKAIAVLTETFVFAYIGLTLFSETTLQSWDWGLVLWACIACIVSRGLNILPLSWLLNRSRERKITGKMQAVMWFSGLRGAIAFALAMNFPGTSGAAVVSTTIFVVLLTTIGLGAFTAPLLSCLGMSNPHGDPHEEPRAGSDEPASAYEKMPADNHGHRQGESCMGRIVAKFSYLDYHYFKPWFGGRPRRRARRVPGDGGGPQRRDSETGKAKRSDAIFMSVRKACGDSFLLGGEGSLRRSLSRNLSMAWETMVGGSQTGSDSDSDGGSFGSGRGSDL